MLVIKYFIMVLGRLPYWQLVSSAGLFIFCYVLGYIFVYLCSCGPGDSRPAGGLLHSWPSRDSCVSILCNWPGLSGLFGPSLLRPAGGLLHSSLSRDLCVSGMCNCPALPASAGPSLSRPAGGLLHISLSRDWGVITTSTFRMYTDLYNHIFGIIWWPDGDYCIDKNKDGGDLEVDSLSSHELERMLVQLCVFACYTIVTILCSALPCLPGLYNFVFFVKNLQLL